jgi:hypothetical protein
LTEAQKKLVRDIYAETGSMRAAARALKIHDRTVLRVLEQSGDIKPRRKNEAAATIPMPVIGEAAPKTTKFEKTESGDGIAVVRYETTECVKTLEDAIRVGEVDLTQWKVDSWTHKSWTVQTNLRTAKGHEEAVQVQQHGVTLKISRAVPEAIHDALGAIYERMAAHAPAYAPFAIRTPPRGISEECLALFCLFDVHFGKLAWAAEAHDNYDLKIAERFFSNAVDDLIAKSVGRNIERILFPLGNDFFHINSSAANTTAAGTPQDVDGRYAKIVEAGEMAFIRAVEKLRGIAPVDIALVPGNHDTNSSYHTARTLKAWFRNCDDVSVDISPSMRKYHAYGKSLIGFTHGNEEKHTALPNLMAMERPREWSESTCRHWFIGHLHHSRKYQTAPVQTHEGVVIHQIRSLAGTDAWHTSRSYLNLDQGAEVYYFGKKTGYDGHNVAYARLEDELKRNAG